MKPILRNFILMAAATALMVLALVYYAAYTGPMPYAEDPVAAAQAARQAEAASNALAQAQQPAESATPAEATEGQADPAAGEEAEDEPTGTEADTE